MTRHTLRDRLAFDDRAVSEILGAIFVFALVVSLLALIQVWAVPAANQQTEFEHNQRTLGDFQQLDGSVDRTAALGVPGSTPIEVGTRYQPRIFLLNPPAPTGTLETEDGTAQLHNARATNAETDDYLDGGPRQFETASLTYRPNYNEYGNAPTTRYEGWTLYNDFDGERIVYDRSGLLSGRTLRLTALDGSVSEATQRSATVPTNPVSAPAQSVSVRGTGPSDPVSVRLTTGLSAAEWSELLGDEEYFDSATQVDDETVEISLQYAEGSDPITYDLRMAKVGVGSGTMSEGPHYLTADGPPDLDSSGGIVTVEVRDRFNAPVSGVDIEFSSGTGDGTFQTESGTANSVVVTSDEDGIARAEFVPSAESVTVTARSDFDDSGDYASRERVSFQDVQVVDSDGGGGDINPNAPGAVIQQDAVLVNCGGSGNCDMNVRFQNTGGMARDAVQGRVNFYSATQGVGAPGVGLDPRKNPDELRFGGTTHDIRGPFEPVSLQSIAGGGTRDYTFEARLDGGGYSIAEGDFLVVSLLFDNGETGTYFIAPREGTLSSPVQTPTPTPTPAPEPPTIDSFDVEDNSVCSNPQGASGNCRNNAATDRAEFDISWSTTNADTTTVTVSRGGSVRETYTGASGDVTFSEDEEYGTTYTVSIEAQSSGGTDSDSVTRRAGS